MYTFLITEHAFHPSKQWVKSTLAQIWLANATFEIQTMNFKVHSFLKMVLVLVTKKNRTRKKLDFEKVIL